MIYSDIAALLHVPWLSAAMSVLTLVVSELPLNKSKLLGIETFSASSVPGSPWSAGVAPEPANAVKSPVFVNYSKYYTA